MDENTSQGEFETLRLRHEALKEQVANQIEMYAHLVDTEGPNIEAQYMMLVGQLECEAMRLDMEVRRWKRRFTLRQMYVNRGEKPDIVAIENILDEEFAEWREKLGALVEKLCDSKLQFDFAKMSDSDTNTIRCEYLKAVKKLHPDLTQNLSESAKSLWNNIQNQLQNLSCFRYLEFWRLGDLEKIFKRLNNSKTPKLQTAKAMNVRQWQRGFAIASPESVFREALVPAQIPRGARG